MTTKRQTILALIVTLLLSTLTPLYAQSVLDRVMKVEDPELADCIRVAMKNYGGGQETVVRTITEHYAQIKLLDTQIEQIEVKLQALSESAFAIRHELILAQAELKAKQMQQLAQLRETMGVIPRYAFGEIQVQTLLSWVVLDVLDEKSVIVYHKAKPFFGSPDTYNPLQDKIILTPSEVIAELRKLMEQPDQLPLRIDILHFPNIPATAEQIQSQLIGIIKKRGLEMDIDLRIKSRNTTRGRATTYLIENHLGIHSSSRVYTKSRNGRAIRGTGWEITNLEDLETFPEYINIILKEEPERLPLTWTLEYDPNSLELAQKAVKVIEKTVQKNNIQDYVEVKLQPTGLDWIPSKKWKINQ